MAAETNVITTEEMGVVRELDFVNLFANEILAKLVEILGVTRKIPQQAGTTLYVYETTGTLQDGNVAEGDIIPLSQYETVKTPVGTIDIKKWRKDVTAEAIQKSGYNAAVTETDAALLKDVQKGVRSSLFAFMNGEISGSTSATGANLQSAFADAWGKLQNLFEDDAVETVYLVNPTDVAEYFKTAVITTQNAFGLKYIEDFLGLGTVILASGITPGTFLATAKENIILNYIPMSGDVGEAFSLTTDQTGLVGFRSGIQNTQRLVIESIAASGAKFMVEYADGVVKGTIGADAGGDDAGGDDAGGDDAGGDDAGGEGAGDEETGE